MNQAVWKLTALAGIVGLGLLVVMQKDGLDKLQLSQLSIDGANPDSDPGAPAQTAQVDPSESGIGGPDGFLDDAPVSADTKLDGRRSAEAREPSGLSGLLGIEQQPEPEPVPEPAPRRPVPHPVADDIGLPIVSADNPRRPVEPARDIPSVDALLENVPLIERPRRNVPPPQLALDAPVGNEAAPTPVEDPQLNPQPAEPAPRAFSRSEPRPPLEMPAIDPEGEAFVNERPAPIAAPIAPLPEAPVSVPTELEPVQPLPEELLPSAPASRLPPANETTPLPHEIPDEIMTPRVNTPAENPLRDDVRPQAPVSIAEDDDDSIRMPASSRQSNPVRSAPPPAEQPAVPFENFTPTPPSQPVRSVPVDDPVIDTAPIIERAAPPLSAADAVPLRDRMSTAQADPNLHADPDDKADFAIREPGATAAVPAAPSSLAPPIDADTVAPEPIPVSVTIDLPRSGGASINLPIDPSRFLEREADASISRDIIPRTIISPPTAIASRDAISPLQTTITTGSRLANARPQLTLEKSAPESAIMGRPLTYNIVIRNDGQVTANQVMVDDVIPAGVRVDGTNPVAESDGKSLVWRLGTLRAGEERQLAVRVTPLRQGTIGSVARVSFAAEVTASTSVLEPPKAALQFELTAPQSASLGGVVPFTFKVTNTGGSDATHVRVRNALPKGLRHASGAELEYEMGLLPAGQSRVVQLDLLAAAPGPVTNRAVVTADGGITTAAVATVDVLGLQLVLDRLGPKMVYVGRNGTFTNTLTNSGEVALRNLTLVETLPIGLEFVSATAGGRYDQRSRQVTWRVERLDPKQVVQTQIVLQSTGRGPQVSQVRVIDANGYSVDASHSMHSGGVAALSILRSELASPIGLGEEIRFKTQIYNRGTEPATNVKLTLVSPHGYEIISARGPTNFASVTGGIQYEPVARIDAGKQLEFEVILRGKQPGEGRLQVQVEADQLEQPLRSEEAGTVFDAAR